MILQLFRKLNSHYIYVYECHIYGGIDYNILENRIIFKSRLNRHLIPHFSHDTSTFENAQQPLYIYLYECHIDGGIDYNILENQIIFKSRLDSYWIPRYFYSNDSSVLQYSKLQPIAFGVSFLQS